MGRFVRVVSVGSTRGSSGPKPRGRFCRRMVTIAVMVVLVTASLSPAQRGAARPMEPVPTRPQETTYPWTLLLAFVLLGLAWYPAFKNSRRELEP